MGRRINSYAVELNMLYVIIIFISYCGADIALRSSYRSGIGNELEQFYHYLKFSDNTFDSTISNSNCSDILDHFQTDIMICNENFYKQHINESFPVLWKKKLPLINSNAPNCRYSIINDSVVIKYEETNKYASLLIVQFRIKQSACRSPVLFALGGTSFDITAHNLYFLAICSCTDLFNNYYNVSCQLPISYDQKPQSEAMNTCMNITVRLEYEHYSAFDTRLIETGYHLSHYIIENKHFCASVPLYAGDSTINTRINMNDTDIFNIQNWQSSESRLGNEKLFSSVSQGIWMYSNSTLKYEWQSYEGVNRMSIGAFFTCLSHHAMNFIGESHMRYTWHYLVGQYLDKRRVFLSSLNKVHGDKQFNHNFKYTSKVFLPVLARYLDSFPCENTSRAIAFQSGAWDLTSLPLRNAILNPAYANKFITSLVNFLCRPCIRRNVNVVLVLPMPYPLCRSDDTYCMSRRRWKTLPAIEALSQYILKGLTAGLLRHGNLSLSDLHFQVVDSSAIIRPVRHDYASSSHFIYADGRRTNIERVLASVGGMALAGEIMRGMCGTAAL